MRREKDSDRAIGEIGAHERVEFGAAENGLESGKILFEAGVETEPVLAVVNLQALERREPVVGADDGLGLAQIRSAIATAARHGFAARERMHDRSGHAALDLLQLAGGLAHRAAPKADPSAARLPALRWG